MLSSDIVTSIQEGYKLIIVLLNNHGYASIGGLSESLGSCGFGTRYLYRDPGSGQLEGERLEVDFAANARSLGAQVYEAHDIEALQSALTAAAEQTRTSVIVIETDREQRVPGYESWWDVPVAEVSDMESVLEAREKYEQALKKERYFL
jgi:3D-(3,5/4)-trihydroxycyclohexane-1,2-dione acylhydrolase (decyclizing)